MAVQLQAGAPGWVHPLHRLRKWPPFARWVMPWMDRPVAARLHGVDFPVQLRRVQHLPYIIDSRVLDPGLAAAFLAVQKLFRPRAFWDVGASIGFHTWLLATVDTRLKAVLFEPDPGTTMLLRCTIANAGLNRVELVERAASAEVGQAEFIDNRLVRMGGHRIESGLGAAGRRILVPTTTLDHELEARGAPDLVKITVAGAEERVLAGAERLVNQVAPIVAIECVAGVDAAPMRRLSDVGYELVNADDPKAGLDGATRFLCLPPAVAARAEEFQARAADERRRWLRRA